MGLVSLPLYQPLEILGIPEETPGPETIYQVTAGHGIGIAEEPIAQPEAVPKCERVIEEVEGASSAIAKMLRPPTQNTFRRAEKSRGRFDYERFSRGSSRFMERKVTPHQPCPSSLCLALDISSSMHGDNIETAVKTAMLLSRSCELAGVPFAAATFGETHRIVGGFGGDEDQKRHCLARVEYEHDTRLSKTLAWALEQKAQNHQQIVVVITDGQLRTNDFERCQQLLQNSKARVLPILIGGDGGAYRSAFGAVMEISDPNQLPQAIQSWLNTQRR